MSIEKRFISISEPKKKEIKVEKIEHSLNLDKDMILTAGKKNKIDKNQLINENAKGFKSPYIVECINCNHRFKTDKLCGVICENCNFKHSCIDLEIVGGS